jgi:hypothetical protein
MGESGASWVFPTEIPEGHWGGRGRITPLAVILTRLTGHDTERARTLAAQRITAGRAEHSRVP